MDLGNIMSNYEPTNRVSPFSGLGNNESIMDDETLKVMYVASAQLTNTIGLL